MPKRGILILFCVFGVAILILLVGRRPSAPNEEPSYNGRTLSDWVVSLNAGIYPAQVDALQSFGTNADPSLLKWICYDTPIWKAAGYEAINRLRSLLKKTALNDRRLILAEKSAIALSWYCWEHGALRGECARLLTDKKTSPKARARLNRVLSTPPRPFMETIKPHKSIVIPSAIPAAVISRLSTLPDGEELRVES
jgi:hypothetical protein